MFIKEKSIYGPYTQTQYNALMKTLAYVKSTSVLQITIEFVKSIRGQDFEYKSKPKYLKYVESHELYMDVLEFAINCIPNKKRSPSFLELVSASIQRQQGEVSEAAGFPRHHFRSRMDRKNLRESESRAYYNALTDEERSIFEWLAERFNAGFHRLN